VLLTDVHGTPAEGEPFHRENALIEVGAEGHLPEFDAALRGATAGADLDVTVAYPAEHPARELAGKAVRYQIHGPRGEGEAGPGPRRRLRQGSR
jgi:FKBP-type peptidyl-prolyl cis-trans isomerase (trigger factor)